MVLCETQALLLFKEIFNSNLTGLCEGMVMIRNFIFSKMLGMMFVVALLSLTGCAGKESSPSPSMAAVTPPQSFMEPEEQAMNQGSLFNMADSDGLYADNRARRIGDIVLVNVVETSKAKSKADTSTTKTSGNEYGVSAAFGRSSVGLLGPGHGPLRSDVGANPLFSTTTNSNLSTTGETKRENYVTTTVGARVIQLLPGGVLQVEGAREIRVNEETQYLVVSGLIRSKDIAMDNSILSTQMADTRIEYFGKGVLADKQRQGWLSRLLDNVWPF